MPRPTRLLSHRGRLDVQYHSRVSRSRIPQWPAFVERQNGNLLMTERQPVDAKRTKPTSFADVTKEIARRNEEAQKVARIKRAAREREQIAARREWERL